MEVFDISESPEKEEEVESVMDDLEVKNIFKTNDKVRLRAHSSLLFQMTVAIYCTTLFDYFYSYGWFFFWVYIQ